MADKFRRTFPLQITFSDGEQPSAAKLTAVATQSRNGSNLLEYAIGDIWNESGDSILNTFELQIPNIARMIGQSQLLNPAIYNLQQTFRFYDYIGARYTGENEGSLRFKPAATPNFGIKTAGNINGTIQEDSPSTVTSTNNVNIDTSTGKVTIFTPAGGENGFAGTEIIYYDVDPSDWIASNEYLPNVIPDPRQTTFTRCRLSESGGTYYLHLPPRQALTLTGFDRPAHYPSTTEVSDSDNQGSTVGSAYRIFQPSTTAIADAHYRYRFPKEIEDNLASMTAGIDQMPYGFLYLWDHTNNTIVRDAIFTKSAINDWVLEVSSVSAASDFATVAAASTDELEASYNANARYSLITIGASLANTLLVLMNQMMTHQHNNVGDFSASVVHNDLVGLDPDPADSGSTFGPTRWENDPHVSSLSRAGSNTGNARDLNDNAMLGDFLLASTVGSNGVFLNTTSESNRIYFGDTTGPSIWQLNDELYFADDSDTRLTIESTGFTFYTAAGKNIYFETPTGGTQTIQMFPTSGSTNQKIQMVRNAADSDDDFIINNGFLWNDIYSPGAKRLALGVGGSQERDLTIGTTGNIGIGTSGIDAVNLLDVDGGVVIGDSYAETETAPTNGLLVQGNVGIGTSAPQNPLDVEGAAVVGASYSGTSTAPANGLLVEGAVGIGTNNPQNKLDVEGAAVIGSSYSGTSSAPANGLLVEGNTGLGTASPQNKLDIEGAAVIGSSYSGTETAPTNGLLIEGDVGIGETSPLANLHIKDSDTGSISPNAGADNLVIESSGDSGLTIYSGNTSDGRILFGDVDNDSIGGWQYDHSGNNALYTYVNNSLRMTINSTGFNLSSPTNGIIYFETPDTGTQTIIMQPASGTTNQKIRLVRTSGDNTKDFEIYNSFQLNHIYSTGAKRLSLGVGGREDLTISTEGKVGIGDIASAKNWLDVVSGVAIGTGYAGVETAPTDGLLVEGNVGIGVTGPSDKLEVAGSVNLSNNQSYKLNDYTGIYQFGTFMYFGYDTSLEQVHIGRISGPDYIQMYNPVLLYTQSSTPSHSSGFLWKQDDSLYFARGSNAADRGKIPHIVHAATPNDVYYDIDGNPGQQHTIHTISANTLSVGSVIECEALIGVEHGASSDCYLNWSLNSNPLLGSDTVQISSFTASAGELVRVHIKAELFIASATTVSGIVTTTACDFTPIDSQLHMRSFSDSIVLSNTYPLELQFDDPSGADSYNAIIRYERVKIS